MPIPSTLPSDAESLKSFCEWFASNNNSILHNEGGKTQFSMINIERTALGLPEIRGFTSTIRSSADKGRMIMIVQYADADFSLLGKRVNDKFDFNFSVWFLKKPASNNFEANDLVMADTWKCFEQFAGYFKEVLLTGNNKALFGVSEFNNDPVTKIIDNLSGYMVNISLDVTRVMCFKDADYKEGSI